MAEAVAWVARNPQFAFAVLHDRRLVGVVLRGDLILAAQERGPFAYVASVMERNVPTTSPATLLTEARSQMNAAQMPFVAVLSGDEFVGLITEQELAQPAAMAHVFERFSPRGGGGSFAHE